MPAANNDDAWFKALSPFEQAAIDCHVMMMVVGVRMAQPNPLLQPWEQRLAQPLTAEGADDLRRFARSRLMGNPLQQAVAMEQATRLAISLQTDPPQNQDGDSVLLDDLRQHLNHLPYPERATYAELTPEGKQTVDALIFLTWVEHPPVTDDVDGLGEEITSTREAYATGFMSADSRTRQVMAEQVQAAAMVGFREFSASTSKRSRVMDYLLRKLHHFPPESYVNYAGLTDEQKQAVDAGVFMELVAERQDASSHVRALALRDKEGLNLRIPQMREHWTKHLQRLPESERQQSEAFYIGTVREYLVEPPKDGRDQLVYLADLVQLLDPLREQKDGPALGGRGGRG